jgi:hypothetical protein
MDESALMVDLVEEQIVKGNLRWLANFSELHRSYQLGDLNIPLYAFGGLEEKGFLLSKLFSSFVTPKYKVHLLTCTSPEFNGQSLRKLIITCKGKFDKDDWIFLALIQSKPIDSAFKKTVESVGDRTIGVEVYSLASRERISSQNVLGKGFEKQLRLSTPVFEAFDLPSYVKSFSIVFVIAAFLLFLIQLFFASPLLNLSVVSVAVVLLFLLSVIFGHALYKSRFKTTLQLTTEGFELRQGKSVVTKKWMNFRDAAIYITPRRETCIRLYGKDETFDLPISRVGLSRKEVYGMVKQAVKK